MTCQPGQTDNTSVQVTGIHIFPLIFLETFFGGVLHRPLVMFLSGGKTHLK